MHPKKGLAVCIALAAICDVCYGIKGRVDRAGGELLKALAQHGSYSEDIARQCFKQLLSGVAYMHAHGVAHRDIKLENLLLEKPGDITNIIIVDFGLAFRHQGSNLLEMDTICGTPHYIAPEIIEV